MSYMRKEALSQLCVIRVSSILSQLPKVAVKAGHLKVEIFGNQLYLFELIAQRRMWECSAKICGRQVEY